MAKKSTPIPGLTFSWKRALGITQAKQKISRKTGIPMTKQGIERKIGGAIIRKLFGKKMEEKDTAMQIEGGTGTLSETVSLTLEGIS